MVLCRRFDYLQGLTVAENAQTNISRTLSLQHLTLSNRLLGSPRDGVSARIVFFLGPLGQADSAMKADIHPAYNEVVFVDSATGVQFLTRSTLKTDKTVEIDGRKVPMATVDISSASHPFFTGKQKFIDTAGRVEKFQKKYKWGEKKAEA